MRHIIWKNFAVWDYDKEEKWLNDMSARGLQLVNPGIGRYTFEEGAPGEYQYRIEYLDKWPKHPESAAYIRFVEESGIEHMGSVKNWVYFRQKVTGGGFELFNDINSRLKHLRKIFRLIAWLAPVTLFWVAYSIVLGISQHSALLYFCAGFITVLGVFLIFGVVKMGLKIRALKKERRIHE